MKFSLYTPLTSILTILILSMFLPDLSAQVKLPGRLGKRAQNAVERKLERKANEKADEVVDKTIEKLLEKTVETDGSTTEPAGNEQESQDSPSERYEPSDDVKVSIEDDPDAETRPVEKSDFIGSFTMEMHEYKNDKLKKDYPMTMGYHIDAYRLAMEINDPKGKEKSIVVYDRQSRKMIMKQHEKGEKTAMIMKMPNYKITIEDQSHGADGTYELRPTGKTKTILGYHCEEYVVETDEEITHVWITKELDTDLWKSLQFGSSVQMKGKDGQTLDYTERFDMQGTWLEMHAKSKQDNTSRDIYLKDLVIGKVGDSIFSTDGYQVTDVSSMFRN